MSTKTTGQTDWYEGQARERKAADLVAIIEQSADQLVAKGAFATPVAALHAYLRLLEGPRSVDGWLVLEGLKPYSAESKARALEHLKSRIEILNRPAPADVFDGLV